MENYSSLLDTIKNAIRENNNGEITGDILQAVLVSMVNTIGEYPTFAGVATPSTNPSGVEQNVFYLASQAGFYNSFRSGLELKKGLHVLYQSAGTWTAASLLSEEDFSGSGTSEYSSNCTLSESSSEVKIILSGNEPKYFLSKALTDTASSDVQVSFQENYFGSSFITSEIIFVLRCPRATTIRVGNTGGAPLSGLPTSWQVPAGGSIALQFLRTSTFYVIAIPLYVTPSASSGELTDGAVTTPKIANAAVTTEKIAVNAVNSLRLADKLTYLSKPTLVDVSYDDYSATVLCKTESADSTLGRYYAHAIVDASVGLELEEIYIELPQAGNIMELILFLEVHNIASPNIAVFTDSSYYDIETNDIQGILSKDGNTGVIHLKRTLNDERPTFVSTMRFSDPYPFKVPADKIANQAITAHKLSNELAYAQPLDFAEVMFYDDAPVADILLESYGPNPGKYYAHVWIDASEAPFGLEEIYIVPAGNLEHILELTLYICVINLDSASSGAYIFLDEIPLAGESYFTTGRFTLSHEYGVLHLKRVIGGTSDPTFTATGYFGDTNQPIVTTDMPEPEQDVFMYPEGPIGMHSASGMQGLYINLFHVKNLNFFKHTIYVTDYANWEPRFGLANLGDYEIHCVYWRQLEDGGGYSNTITYPADGLIENPLGYWPDTNELVKIEIEGFSTTIDADGNTSKRIIITVTTSVEV